MIISHQVPLVGQCSSMTCHYASAQMLVRWYKSLPESSAYRNGEYKGTVDEAGATTEMCSANAAFKPDFISSLARAYKFHLGQFSTTNGELIEPWLAVATTLMLSGPLWYGGNCTGYRGKTGGGHVVVITGIDTQSETLYINDPDPIGTGTALSYDCSTFLPNSVRHRNPQIVCLSPTATNQLEARC
ncbi:MAG: papain-like cysteine protease family protein [Pirellulaceae bacterium]